MPLNKLFEIKFNFVKSLARTSRLLALSRGSGSSIRRPVWLNQTRDYSNENENESKPRPFALFQNRQLYHLPNPFKVLIQNLRLRWEMARIDAAFNLVDFYRGSQMVSRNSSVHDAIVLFS